MHRSTKFEEFVGAVANLHDARTERDIFSAFHAACETVVGSLSLAGYVVARNGETVRDVAEIGDPGLSCSAGASGILSCVTDWLVGGQEFPVLRAADGSPIVGYRLISGTRVVGGVILTGRGLAH